MFTMSNRDSQGTLRYECNECRCDQYSSPKGLKCECGHVPTKHSDIPPRKQQSKESINQKREVEDRRRNRSDSDDDRDQFRKSNRRRSDSDDDRDQSRKSNRRRSDSDDDRDNKPKDKDSFSNCDVKGTKRFNCTECQCDGFWWKASLDDTKCVLCGHMPAAHGTSSNTKPAPAPASSKSAQTKTSQAKTSQRTTNLDRNRKPRLKCSCGNCDGFERYENGSDCVNCGCIADHHKMKEYGACKDVSCNCDDYVNDARAGQFDCECGHKIAKHEKLTTTEPKSFVIDPNSTPKILGPKKCVCGKDAYVDKKTGQVFDKCGKSCTGVPVSSSNASGKTQLCQKCNKRPVYPGSQFCGNTCRLAK